MIASGVKTHSRSFHERESEHSGDDDRRLDRRDGYVVMARAQQRNAVPQPPAGAAAQQGGQRAGGQRGQQGLPGTETG